MELYLPPPAPAIVRAANLDSIRSWREAIEENRRYPYWKERQRRFREYQDAMRLGFLPLVPALMAMRCAPLTMSFVTSGSSTTNATSYSFASQSLGVAHPLRWIVVSACSQTGANINSMTLGGSSMSMMRGNQTATAATICYFPSGTSATLAYTVAATSGQTGYAIYSIIGLLKPDRIPGADNVGYDSANAANIATVAGHGGCGLLVGRSGASGTWTTSGTSGYTQDVDLSIESTMHFLSGHATNISATGSYTFSITNSNASCYCRAFMWSP